MLSINNAAINWRAIRMDVEDRQKDSDTARSRFEHLGFIRFNDVYNSSIGGSHNYIRIRRRQGFRVAKKKKKKRKPAEKRPPTPRGKCLPPPLPAAQRSTKSTVLPKAS